MRALHHVGGDDAVDLTDDARLLRDPELRLQLVRRPRHAVLEPTQGVEHLDHWRAPPLPQLERGHAGQPVVRVDEVVAEVLGLAELVDAGHELGQVLVHHLARHRPLRPGREMDHPRVVAEGHDAADARILRAGEHVHLDAHPTQLARGLAHVHVHPARLLGAQRGQRAGVDGQHRDAQVHGDTRTLRRSVGTGPKAYL